MSEKKPTVGEIIDLIEKVLNRGEERPWLYKDDARTLIDGVRGMRDALDCIEEAALCHVDGGTDDGKDVSAYVNIKYLPSLIVAHCRNVKEPHDA